MSQELPAKMIRDILVQCLPENLVRYYTGWEPTGPIYSPVNSFHRKHHPFAEWATVKQYGCTPDQAFHLLMDALETLPYETLKLKSDNCTVSKLSSFPNHLATDDILFHSRKVYWTPIEATLLSLGIVPDNDLEMHFGNMGIIDSSVEIPIIHEYKERLKLIKLKFFDNVNPNKINPVDILNYLQDCNFSCPIALVEAVANIGGNNARMNIQPTNSGQNMKSNEKLSYLKVIGVAVSDSYKIKSKSDAKHLDDFFEDFSKSFNGFDRANVEEIIFRAIDYIEKPNRKVNYLKDNTLIGSDLMKITSVLAKYGYSYVQGNRSDTVTSISHKLDLVGLSLDKKTIRKCLNNSLKILP